MQTRLSLGQKPRVWPMKTEDVGGGFDGERFHVPSPSATGRHLMCLSDVWEVDAVMARGKEERHIELRALPLVAADVSCCDLFRRSRTAAAVRGTIVLARSRKVLRANLVYSCRCSPEEQDTRIIGAWQLARIARHSSCLRPKLPRLAFLTRQPRPLHGVRVRCKRLGGNCWQTDLRTTTD
ncbi:MAG: hypothetical protein JWQ56_4121 [Pseudarthrobacter sp.]|nr:hypothetical protein [Pseudarthrobacter sp.]